MYTLNIDDQRICLSLSKKNVFETCPNCHLIFLRGTNKVRDSTTIKERSPNCNSHYYEQFNLAGLNHS